MDWTAKEWLFTYFFLSVKMPLGPSQPSTSWLSGALSLGDKVTRA